MFRNLLDNKKAASPAFAGVTASVDTVSLTAIAHKSCGMRFCYSFFDYELNLIFLVVTSATMGNPS
jgi:hypothetical protein